MTYQGRVEKGQILLDQPAKLPEGARVRVEVAEEIEITRPIKPRKIRDIEPIDLPGGSLADELVRERR